MKTIFYIFIFTGLFLSIAPGQLPAQSTQSQSPAFTADMAKMNKFKNLLGAYKNKVLTDQEFAGYFASTISNLETLKKVRDTMKTNANYDGPYVDELILGIEEKLKSNVQAPAKKG